MKAFPYGEAGIYVDLEIEDSPDRAARTHAAVRAVRARLPTADVVAGAGVLAIFQVGAWDTLDAVVDEAAHAASAPVETQDDETPVVLDAVYDGPDLDDVARVAGMSASDVADLHAAATYRVELLGFLPGFAYLGPVDPRLALPRRATPRASVAAGSIGLAGGFTGVYPAASPGGWNLLGRVLDFAPLASSPDRGTLLRPGRCVRFQRVPARAARPLVEVVASLAAPSRCLVVERAPACATVQDAGRDGVLGDGFPPSGPLDGAAFTAANLAVGNPARAAALEIPRGTLAVRARGELRVSIDGAPATTLHDGESLVVPMAARAVRYLAVAGGVEVPVVHGARATLVSARLGGFHGRPLRRGDLVSVGAHAGARLHHVESPLDPPPRETLVIDPGPHAARFPDAALAHLLGTTYRVSSVSDRVGVRLDGAPLPHAPRRLHLPVPMVRGAIEITPDGTAIVLGPDHPTTGGYPVLAVVRRASQSRLARLPPGHELCFVLG